MVIKLKIILGTTVTLLDYGREFSLPLTINPHSCNTDFLNDLNNYFGQFDALNNTPAVKATIHHD